MKSALANIGEFEKSKLAQNLEEAGLDNDTDYICANLEEFVNSLEVLIDTLKPLDSNIINDSDIHEDKTFLKKQLSDFIIVCEEYDDAKGYELLDQINEKTWKKDTNEQLKKIRDLLFLDSDFEAAIEHAHTMLLQLNEGRAL